MNRNLIGGILVVTIAVVGVIGYYFIQGNSKPLRKSTIEQTKYLNSPNSKQQNVLSSFLGKKEVSKETPSTVTFKNISKNTSQTTAPKVSVAAPSSSYKRPEHLGGEEATANIKAGGKTYNLEPNQSGVFGRIYIGKKEKVNVTVSYPQAAPEEPLIIESEDGGVLFDGKKTSVVKTDQLNQSKQVSFDFQSSEEEGIFRVTLRKGTDLKQIDFWVGAELPVAKR